MRGKLLADEDQVGGRNMTAFEDAGIDTTLRAPARRGPLDRLRDWIRGEDRLAAEIVRTARTPHVVTDMAGRIRLANDAALAGLGPLDIGVTLSRALSSMTDDLEALARAGDRDGFAVRTATLSRDGRECCYDISARRIEYPAPALIWCFEDVTAARRQEVARATEHEAFTRTLRDLDVGICVLDDEGRVHSASECLAEWLGLQPEEMLFRDVEALMGPGARNLLGGPIGTDGDTAPPLVGRLRGVGDEPIEVSVVRAALEAPSSSDRHTRALIRNLSREGDRLAALEIAEQQVRMLFDGAPMAAATLDGEGRIVQANVAFRNLEPNLPLVGRPLAELIEADDREIVDTMLERTLADRAEEAGVDVRSDSHLIGKRELRLFASRLAAGPDDGAGILIHAMDVTEQRGIENQFAQAQKMQAVGQLAGGVAHDFNNLLTAIIGHTDLLMLRIQPGDEAFPDIMQIKQNANRAANLVRQLLAFSRRQTLMPTVLDLTEVMAEITHLLRRLIGENIELKVAHGRDLGLIKVDKSQLETVIINLAVNARDAMTGGGRLEIRSRNVVFEEAQGLGDTEVPAGSYVQLQVSDTGSGITQDMLDKIFDPFFTTKPQGEGTGLGLSTVYGIVRQTGGFVHVESELGVGTTFHIYLPHHRDGVQPAAVVPLQRQPRDLSGKGTILLVEDENAVRTFAARALRNKGYVVLDCSGGEIALETLRRHEGGIDLVISDVVMPIMDGPTLVRNIRADHPDLKVIFISGYAEQAFRESLEDGGNYELLPKPFSLADLAAKVKDVLGQDDTPEA